MSDTVTIKQPALPAGWRWVHSGTQYTDWDEIRIEEPVTVKYGFRKRKTRVEYRTRGNANIWRHDILKPEEHEKAAQKAYQDMKNKEAKYIFETTRVKYTWDTT